MFRTRLILLAVVVVAIVFVVVLLGEYDHEDSSRALEAPSQPTYAHSDREPLPQKVERIQPHRLKPAGGRSGTRPIKVVTAGRRTPLPDTSVFEIHDPGAEDLPPVPPEITDGSGVAWVSGAAPFLFLMREGYSPKCFGLDASESAQGIQVIALEPCGVLRGAVLDANGLGVEGLRLSISTTYIRGTKNQPLLDRGQRTVISTDPAGRFLVSELPVGPVRIEILDRGFFVRSKRELSASAGVGDTEEHVIVVFPLLVSAAVVRDVPSDAQMRLLVKPPAGTIVAKPVSSPKSVGVPASIEQCKVVREQIEAAMIAAGFEPPRWKVLPILVVQREPGSIAKASLTLSSPLKKLVLRSSAA